MEEQINCFAIINGLRKIQAREYTYPEFLDVLKRRIYRYTGLQEVLFYSDVQICDKLIELGVVE